jgi:transcription initiation factor TFIIIB Brf1 subunit/transcription initiation factor TFIIB
MTIKAGTWIPADKFNEDECPNCKSTDISGEEYDFETNNRDITCQDCGCKWAEVYILKGAEILDEDLWEDAS